MTDENNNLSEDILGCRCTDCVAVTQSECTSTQLRRALSDIFDEEPAPAGRYCRNDRKIQLDDDVDCRCPDCALNPGDGQTYCCHGA